MCVRADCFCFYRPKKSVRRKNAVRKSLVAPRATRFLCSNKLVAPRATHNSYRTRRPLCDVSFTVSSTAVLASTNRLLPRCAAHLVAPRATVFLIGLVAPRATRLSRCRRLQCSHRRIALFAPLCGPSDSSPLVRRVSHAAVNPLSTRPKPPKTSDTFSTSPVRSGQFVFLIICLNLFVLNFCTFLLLTVELRYFLQNDKNTLLSYYLNYHFFLFLFILPHTVH